MYRYTANLLKIWKDVQLCRLILRLLNALFILNCKFQNCTAIVQLKVTIYKSLNLKNFIRYFPL